MLYSCAPRCPVPCKRLAPLSSPTQRLLSLVEYCNFCRFATGGCKSRHNWTVMSQSSSRDIYIPLLKTPLSPRVLYGRCEDINRLSTYLFNIPLGLSTSKLNRNRSLKVLKLNSGEYSETDIRRELCKVPSDKGIG